MNARWVRRSFLISLGGAAILASCRSAPILYADTECGNCTPSLPPFVRPSRAVDHQLQIAGRGRLVVRIDAYDQPTAALVVLERPSDRAHSIQQTTSSNGVTVFDALAVGEYTVRARRVGLQPQSMRVLISIGFADTPIFGLGQRWSGSPLYAYAKWQRG